MPVIVKRTGAPASPPSVPPPPPPTIPPTVAANRVYAGPATGAAAAPTFRSLVAADLPDLSSQYASAGSGVTSFNTRTGAVTLTSGDVTGALGFTPASSGHTHTAGEIADFSESVDDRVSALLVQGAGVTLTYDDATNKLTIATSAGTYQPLDSQLTALAGIDTSGGLDYIPYFWGGDSSGAVSAGTLRRSTDGTLSLNADNHIPTQKAVKTYVDNAVAAVAGVASFNARTGAVTLTSADVTGALGFTPSASTHTHAYADLTARPAALDAVASLTPAADGLAYYTSGTAAAMATLTAFGRSLIDDADATAARATLGLGSIATQAAGSVAITGGSVTGITDLAVADGGTGASSAAAARTNLGLVIGTDVQAHSATLAAVAGGTYTGAASITTLGTVTAGTWQGTAVAVAHGGTGAGTAADARANLGLVIGTDVQAHSATLAAFAGGTDVRAYRGTTQAIAAATPTVVVFDTESVDALNEYDPATGVFTPTSSGLYLVSAMATTAAEDQRCLLVLRVGSTGVRRIADGWLVSPGGTVLVALTAGTGYTVSFQAVTSGTTLQAGENQTYFMVRRVA